MANDTSGGGSPKDGGSSTSVPASAAGSGAATPVIVSIQKKYSDSEVKAMSSKKYMDELVIPTLLKAMAATNKQRPVDPIEFMGRFLLKSGPGSGGGGEASSRSGSQTPVTEDSKNA